MVAPARKACMQCDFCDSRLTDAEPPNLALLAHVRQNAACNEQYGYLLENLRTSWTPTMSGG